MPVPGAYSIGKEIRARSTYGGEPTSGRAQYEGAPANAVYRQLLGGTGPGGGRSSGACANPRACVRCSSLSLASEWKREESRGTVREEGEKNGGISSTFNPNFPDLII